MKIRLSRNFNEKTGLEFFSTFVELPTVRSNRISAFNHFSQISRMKSNAHSLCTNNSFVKPAAIFSSKNILTDVSRLKREIFYISTSKNKIKMEVERITPSFYAHTTRCNLLTGHINFKILPSKLGRLCKKEIIMFAWIGARLEKL